MGKPEARKVATPWESCVEARRGRPGGERFDRESFTPKGVKRKTWSCAARSVSDWGLIHHLVLTEKHQHVADTQIMSSLN
eukprot:4278677-Pyramimonas_sp.AAC.1